MQPGYAPAMRGTADAITWGWEQLTRHGTIGPKSRRARRFGVFGDGSAVCFPVTALYGEEYIHLGEQVIIGPYGTLSAGVMPGHVPDHDPVLTIGDRTLIGKGSGIVGHSSITIGSDVWTGHHVYVTDANHGYEDVSLPPGLQFSAPRPVVIADGAWLGHGTIVLPGASIGKHTVIGGGSVVTGAIPDFCVAVGNPARVIRRYVLGEGWQRVEPAATDPAYLAGDG
jgi:acetyltransferase-like isoleucine patch superfamily enzyme